MLYTNKITFLRDDNRIHLAGFCFLKGDLDDLLKKTSLLHKNEIKHLNELVIERRKHSYLLGRLASKKAIEHLIKPTKKLSDIFIDYGVFFFPVVKTDQYPGLSVSISHTNDIGVAIAFNEEHPLSIDIERIEISNNNIDKYLTDYEKITLKPEMDDVKYYTAIWTIKESLSKTLRIGLTIDLKILELKTFVKNNQYFVSTFKNFSQYKAVSKIYDDYVCSFVCPKNSEIEDLNVYWESLNSILNKKI